MSKDDRIIPFPTLPRDADDVRLWSVEMRCRELERKLDLLGAALFTILALNMFVALLWLFLS